MNTTKPAAAPMPEREVQKVVFLGTSDEVQQCECCGRKNLKSTVVLEIEDGGPVYYGSQCAALALKFPATYVVSESRKADRARAQVETAARQKAWQEEMAPWFAFLAARGVGDNDFTRIESLGGYVAARALFAAERAKSSE